VVSPTSLRWGIFRRENGDDMYFVCFVPVTILNHCNDKKEKRSNHNQNDVHVLFFGNATAEMSKGDNPENQDNGKGEGIKNLEILFFSQIPVE